MSAIPLRRIEGKYEILEKLGEGGMGAVYKVRHRLLDDVRVIKMMRSQLVTDGEFKARFQREARVAIRLRHPNIAQLLDFTMDEEDGTAFIVMEFIDGMTLEEVLLNSGPPPLGLALEIAQQSLRALACLHEKGFVHRDISPDNLMLTEDVDGRPLIKLIDLGIAKVLGAGAETGNLTGSGIFLGKVRYSPPEQFGAEGASGVDARGDLYSFGIVFYELLTGKYPIQGRDHSAIIAGHLFRTPLDFAEADPAGHVPLALRALVLKAMAKEPAQRFASARELGLALAALRAPGDVADGDLKRALTRPPTGTVRIPLPPGSTQNRLNDNFGFGTTPSRVIAEGKTAAPMSTHQMAGVVATIERHLQRSDLLTAETELRWAVDSFGEQPELSALRLRLQQRRTQELEMRVQTLLREAEGLFAGQDYEGALERLQRGRALAPRNAGILALLEQSETAARERRRARDVAGVREEIEAALARSDFRAAEMQLYEAEASYGEQEAFAALHERLGELRREKLEARRRIEKLAATAGEIHARLTRGELDEAERLLGEAVSTYGEEPALAELSRRLEELRQAARQAAAAALVQIAVQRRDEADLEGALEEARRALEIDPDYGIARSLAAGLAAELDRRAEAARQAAREAETAAAERHRREEEAQKAEQLAAAAAAVEERLGEGDLAAAGALLEEAVASHGEAEALRHLRSRLEDLRQAAREKEVAAEIAGLVEDSRRRREEGDLEATLATTRRILALDAENAAARALMEEAEAAKRQREEEARRAEQLAAEEARRSQQLATAVATIDACLEQGDAEGAARFLPGLVAVFGDTEPLRQRWERIESLRRRKVEERVAGLVEKSRKLVAGGELEAALGGLREAGRLLPDHADVRTLTAEIEAELQRQDEESRRELELAAALSEIDACLERQDLSGAARLLPAAVAAFGGAPALRERWERLESLQRQARAETLRIEADALIQAGHLDRAKRKLRQALDLDPGNRALADRLSEIAGG
ncbi:MAG TPA: protein kinase [Thermoanaerobaculia bacterium]|nr:protein kinase [Thermoanaerobaculia bacterium]